MPATGFAGPRPSWAETVYVPKPDAIRRGRNHNQLVDSLKDDILAHATAAAQKAVYGEGLDKAAERGLKRLHPYRKPEDIDLLKPKTKNMSKKTGDSSCAQGKRPVDLTLLLLIIRPNISGSQADQLENLIEYYRQNPKRKQNQRVCLEFMGIVGKPIFLDALRQMTEQQNAAAASESAGDSQQETQGDAADAPAPTLPMPHDPMEDVTTATAAAPMVPMLQKTTAINLGTNKPPVSTPTATSPARAAAEPFPNMLERCNNASSDLPRAESSNLTENNTVAETEEQGRERTMNILTSQPFGLGGTSGVGSQVLPLDGNLTGSLTGSQIFGSFGANGSFILSSQPSITGGLGVAGAASPTHQSGSGSGVQSPTLSLGRMPSSLFRLPSVEFPRHDSDMFSLSRSNSFVNESMQAFQAAETDNLGEPPALVKLPSVSQVQLSDLM
eukprot:GFYU01000948.1.p1 GENE.GFYU01000948.1~~GFYU01000948.1.p1  ORF type:complete len:443 (+),score=123.16 GFYU01000948.1:284-1612(+)